MRRFILLFFLLTAFPLPFFLASCGGGGSTPVTTTTSPATTTTTSLTTTTGGGTTTTTSTTTTTTVPLPFSVTGLQTGHGLNEDGMIIMPATVFTNVTTVCASAATNNPTGSSKNVSFAWLKGGTTIATHSATVPTGSGRIADRLSYFSSLVPDGNYVVQVIYGGSVGAQASFTVSSRLASLSGKITATGTTEPVANQRLWLMKDGYLHYSATSEANGNYLVSGIAPNTYSLLLPNSKYYLSPEGTSITLTAGEYREDYNLSMEKRLTWEAVATPIGALTQIAGTVYNNGPAACHYVYLYCYLISGEARIATAEKSFETFPGSSSDTFNFLFLNSANEYDHYQMEVFINSVDSL